MPKRNTGKRLEWREDRATWEIVWYERGKRRRRSCGTQDRGEADQQLSDALSGERPAGPCDPSERPITQILNAYMDEHAPTVADPERIGYAVKALLPFWERNMAGDVKGSTCRAYARHRAKKKIGDGTIRRELTTLRAAINHDYREGRLTRPVPVVLPKRPPAREVWCDRDEIARMVRSARKQKRARKYLPHFILLAFYTGQRKRAILGLRKPQIDQQSWVVDFNPPGRVQTAKRRPKVPAPRKLLTTLRPLLERTPDLGFVINLHGRPVHDIKHGFAKAAKDAGLHGVTPHTMRHSAATHMVRNGAERGVVSEFIGASKEVIDRVYAHHAPDYLEEAKKAFD